MPDIAVEQSTFERLQHHAKPLVDTPDTVVNRALDALELSATPPTLPPLLRQSPAVAERNFDWRAPPDVTHTRLSDAALQGRRIEKPNWNLLVNRMLVLATELLSDFEAVRKVCPVNMVRGFKDDEGYRYLPEIGLSFQGASANDALRGLIAAAHSLGIELEVGFSWHPKEAAAYPGERGRLRIPART